jgi:hypothetical protein
MNISPSQNNKTRGGNASVSFQYSARRQHGCFAIGAFRLAC